MNPSNPPSPTPSRKPGWLSHPLLSLLLGASWLALSHSLEPVHLLSALLIALIVPRLLHPFLGEHARIDWLAAVRLTLVVLKDIVVANITVARLVLGPLPRMQPAWLPVPLACARALPAIRTRADNRADLDFGVTADMGLPGGCDWKERCMQK